MSKPCSQSACTGCRACENICPKSAIICQKDEKGFLYPEINLTNCINCGLCEAVCNYSDTKEPNRLSSTIAIYGYKKNSDDIRKKSSSGGAFYSLADMILKEDGVVYGCVLNDNIDPVYNRAETLTDCYPMMGSKYVQSDLGKIYQDIVSDLKSKRMLLFTGAPCQCQALKSFLKTKHIDDSLVLYVEFLCHGGPSPRVFERYKNAIEEKYNGKIVEFKFRDKECVKNLPSSRGMRSWVKQEDGHVKNVYDAKMNNIFFELFKRNYISRTSCYSCQYVGFDNRSADISLADFWGCEKSYPDFFDKKGISLILVNSEKGEDIFSHLKMTGESIEVEKDKCLQAPLLRVPRKPENYDEFWDYYNKHDYKKTAPKFTRGFRAQKVYHEIRHSIKLMILGERR